VNKTSRNNDIIYFQQIMSGKKKKKDERPVFDSIRKPVAPPSRKMGLDKPEEKRCHRCAR